MNKIKEQIKEVEKKIKAVDLEIQKMRGLDDLFRLETLKMRLNDIIQLRDEKKAKLKVYEERIK